MKPRITPLARAMKHCVPTLIALLVSPLILRAAPPPIQIPDAVAKTEGEMKPYIELIEHTEEKFEMVPIRGGKFVMGSPASEKGRKDDEGPPHEVEVEPFWMGKYE